MVEVKAGQWWTDRGSVAERHRILVRGLTSGGKRVICEASDDRAYTLSLDYFLNYKEHLPECTSFEWVPEVYPQYRETYQPEEFAFVRLNSPSGLTYVRLDGTEEPEDRHGYAWSHVNDRPRLTETEALARIKKPEPKTRTVKVHTVAYGLDKLKFVSKVLDTELDGVKRDWQVFTILKTEEFEVSCG